MDHPCTKRNLDQAERGPASRQTQIDAWEETAVDDVMFVVGPGAFMLTYAGPNGGWSRS